MCGMTNGLTINRVTTGPRGVDGAVGVPATKWYIAVVGSRHEKSVAQKLADLGFETFVASQREMHVWKNGRRKMVDRIVIPSTVFIKCSERQRRELLTLPFISRFMVNRTADSGSLNKPAATVPDDQIARLRFMLGQTDTPVYFEPTQYHVCDNVRVIRGHFIGLEGRITKNSDGSHRLTVEISMLGGATINIDPNDVEKI